MKTNYNNLTFFEICAVVAAVAGLVLICFEVYIALPSNEKIQVSNAFVMFDMHEDFALSAEGFRSIRGVAQNYYDQFDLAFTEIFSYPDEIGTPVIKFAETLDSYSHEIAMAYAQNNVANTESVGQVLGAMLVKTTDPVLSTEQATSKPLIRREYYYHAPEIVQKILK